MSKCQHWLRFATVVVEGMTGKVERKREVGGGWRLIQGDKEGKRERRFREGESW